MIYSLKFNFLFCFILSGLLIAESSIAANSDSTKVVILSINDQHAKIDNYDRLKALVDKVRTENNFVLLFASGDNFTGNPIVDMHEDKGFPMIDLMNITGFDATAIGNHEFDYGQSILSTRMKQANFPFLSANIIAKSGKLEIKPYKIFTLKNGLKIAVTSVVQLGSNGLPDSHPGNLEDLEFKDGIEALNKYKYLRDSSNIFIVLSHLGFEKDMELANALPEIDLILGGHTHTLTKPAYTVNDVVISQAGSNVKNLGKTTVYVVDGKVVKIVPEMLSILDFPEKDPYVVNKLMQFNDNKELNRVIGFNQSEMSSKEELGSLMTDAITNRMEEIDFAFQNNGGIRIDFLDKGPITVKDIYKLDPFGNEVILIQMKPKEIKSLIINAFKDAGNSIDLQVSGMTYTILTDKQQNAIDVELKDQKGKKLKANKTYNVGLNSYIASSYKFDHRDVGKSLYKTTAQTLIDYIQSMEKIDYKGSQRAFVRENQ